MSDPIFTLFKGGVAKATFAHRPRPTVCYACFDMERGKLYTCPACGEGYGKRRLPEKERPPRPMWPDA